MYLCFYPLLSLSKLSILCRNLVMEETIKRQWLNFLQNVPAELPIKMCCKMRSVGFCPAFIFTFQEEV